MRRTHLNPRGLTLIELCIALTILVILATMSVPSLGTWTSRHRLRVSAMSMATDMAEARQQAARVGHPVYVNYRPGNDWCYVIASAKDADCRLAGPGQLKVVRAAEHPGVVLLEARNLGFDNRDGTRLSHAGHAILATRHGDQINVRLSPLGRPSLCTPEAPLKDLSPC